MIISGTYIPTDVWATYWLQVKPRRSYAIAGIILVAALIFSLYAMIVDSKNLKAVPGGVKWTLIASILYLTIYAASSARLLRKKFREIPTLSRLHIFEATDQGLTVSSQTGLDTIPWSDFKNWKADKRILLLYVGSFPYCMIPRRFFQTEHDYNAFLKILAERVGRNPLGVDC